MKCYIKRLQIEFKKSKETISFKKINYFYGQMGAGKTSIVKLIDYCFGGNLEYSPAMQQEFVSVNMLIFLEGKAVLLDRARGANSVIVKFKENKDVLTLQVPITATADPLIDNTKIFCLSDLIFYLAGINSPRVRRSKVKEDSELQRLSIRNLLWYCYLDQDNIDNNFFYLDRDENPFKRLQSRDVLRYVIGFHQEKVAELEQELYDLREKRRELKVASNSLQSILEEVGISDFEEINESIRKCGLDLANCKKEIERYISKEINKNDSHVVDTLKDQLRYIFSEIESLEQSKVEIIDIIEKDKRHLNEIKMMILKINRSQEARNILKGVKYKYCPSCAQGLHQHPEHICNVCGGEINNEIVDKSNQNIEIDSKQRILELSDSIKRHSRQLKLIEAKTIEKKNEKIKFDKKLNEVLESYNSSYLANILDLEERKFSLQEKIQGLETVKALPGKAMRLLEESHGLTPEINLKNEELKRQRGRAEKDTKNLRVLETKFLEYLLRSKFPGVKDDDIVQMVSPEFLPEVHDMKIGDLATTSFSNVSSGGKKTLFKSCFALAFHSLALKNETILPTLLILDTPMKNISERENVEQFESFINLVYELHSDELRGVQLIIVDKEYYKPKDGAILNLFVRHMKPNDEENPPLIPYYKGGK
ncbi:hypothetical protein ACFL49_00990 [Candidatus Omnitrophota bacterium]